MEKINFITCFGYVKPVKNLCQETSFDLLNTFNGAQTMCLGEKMETLILSRTFSLIQEKITKKITPSLIAPYFVTPKN